MAAVVNVWEQDAAMRAAWEALHEDMQVGSQAGWSGLVGAGRAAINVSSSCPDRTRILGHHAACRSAGG